ncbi:MAG TPA: N-acetyl-alpha-D-glucosaminyl L-malate synthase BshA [candidate division Zixibacteria bacterium]|nr:N-acetyl-alpha-D-glucosaminyl L-malate synthase BshA [candidate division Zixibacteria bacterium]
MIIGITCYPVAGGSGIVATELGQQLAARGHQVHFVSYALPFRLDKYQTNLMYHGVETTAYPLFKYPPYTLTLAAKMAEVARNFELDIMHVHYAIPHAACAYLARQLLQQNSPTKQPKIITTLHGTDITLVGADPSYYDITRFSIRASDGLTAVSKYLADETRQVFEIEKDIRVVHNFFDDLRFQPKMSHCSRTEFVQDDEFLLAHVSNFRPVKRTLDVIDIFDKVRQELPARLLLIGEGPDTILARRQINKKGLGDRVIFLGNQSRVEAVLPCADLFLMPSEEESFGLAALEALACGVPVIGTQGTGLVEVVDDYRDGFLLPVGDTTSMARAAIALLKDTERHKEFRKAAAEIARRRFSADKIVGEYESYYQEILDA